MSSGKFHSDSSFGKPEEPSIRRNEGGGGEPCAKKAKVVSKDVMADQALGLKGTQVSLDRTDGKTVRTFDWNRLPFEMKMKVLEKMSIDSLCKFRRTSKQNEEIVRKNRRHFRPEIKHIRSVGFNQSCLEEPILEVGSKRIRFCWEDRWELLGLSKFDDLDLWDVDDDWLDSEVFPFLKQLVNISRIDTLSLNIGTESYALDSWYLRPLFFHPRWPFMELWRTDKDCRLEWLSVGLDCNYDFSFADTLRAYPSWVSGANDDGWQEIWSGDDETREELGLPSGDVLAVSAIYVIKRDFEVGKLGRNGLLFVWNKTVDLYTCLAGETIEESIRTALKDKRSANFNWLI